MMSSLKRLLLKLLTPTARTAPAGQSESKGCLPTLQLRLADVQEKEGAVVSERHWHDIYDCHA
jgi:hypothetical protein